MSTFAVIVVLLVLVFFAGVVALAITVSRQEKSSKGRVAQSLGLTPVSGPDEVLVEHMVRLYRTPWATSRYELRNVSHRNLPDGELFLFDLVDTSGDSDSTAENQDVAIRSPALCLPPFTLFPKVDAGRYSLGRLANRVLEWGVSRMGTAVRFPEYPAFEARYVVSSNHPEAVQQLFSGEKARYFANTEFYTLHADGNLFTFAEIGPGLKVSDPAHVSRRIQRALEIYRLFRR